MHTGLYVLGSHGESVPFKIPNPPADPGGFNPRKEPLICVDIHIYSERHKQARSTSREGIRGEDGVSANFRETNVRAAGKYNTLKTEVVSKCYLGS